MGESHRRSYGENRGSSDLGHLPNSEADRKYTLGHEQKSSRNEEYVKELNSSIAKAESDFWEDNVLPLTSQSSFFAMFTSLMTF
jgi:hypothetical protein